MEISSSIPQKYFTVLTEEAPNIDEIKVMLKSIGEIIPDTISNKNIISNITTDKKGNMFKGEWNLKVNNLNINIKLFKGKTSSIDYMLFDDNSKFEHGNASNALVILESTKTSDSSSRNTAVNQRIVKFTTYDTMYPESNAIKVMFWCDSIWNDKLTDTAIMGFRLMDTLDINMYSQHNGNIINMKEKYNILPFSSCDEIIKFKNSIKQKKGNISIRLSIIENIINISIKLDKGYGKDFGRISHDPNVGFLSAILNAFEKLTINPKKYIIKNHNIEQKYFDSNPKSKFWFSINEIDIEFEGCIIKDRPEIPERYFTLETEMTEKLATILYDQVLSYETIFSNHGGCALTYIKGHNDIILSVGQKMPRPDIVFRNDERKEIEIIEGKLERELSKGIKQLSDTHLKGFIGLLKQLYPDYTIKKGLCITISSIDCINKYSDIEFPVKFALDNEGYFILP